MNTTAKWIWIALLPTVALGLLWQYYPLTDASPRLARLTPRGLMVESRDMALTPTEEANFSGTHVIKRLAAFGRDRVILIVVDGTRNRHAIHDPLFCFRGAGWEVTAQEPVPLEAGVGRLLKLRQKQNEAEALYWFSDGQHQFAGPLEYWWKTALRRLSLGRSGPEPVLVILSSTGDNPPNWPQLLKAWPDLQEL